MQSFVEAKIAPFLDVEIPGADLQSGGHPTDSMRLDFRLPAFSLVGRVDERAPTVGEARDLGRALRTEQNDVEMLPGPWLPHAGHVQVFGRSRRLHGKLRAAARGRQASPQDPSSIMVSHAQPSTEKKAAVRLTLVKEYPKLPSLSRLLWHG